MLRIYLIQKTLSFFDFFDKKKIYNFLKKVIPKKSVLIDVGAHHGETIKNFTENFDFSEIHSFEASKINFEILKKKISNQLEKKVIINNFGLSDEKKGFKIKQFSESSSSTISKINENSKYFKRKIKLLGKSKFNYSKDLDIFLDTFDNYFLEHKLNKIDLLKIDTEGYELKVLKGCIKSLPMTNYIYFEHHYDDMLDKGYTFTDINNFLKKNSFKKIYKSKMYFRKTFEYIYKNSKLM